MLELYIGLMSGTSADGIDAVLVNFFPRSPLLIASHHQPLSPNFRQQILELSQTDAPVYAQQLAALDQEAGYLFAQAVMALLGKTDFTPDQITAIGSHGQTLYHWPPSKQHNIATSWQIGDPNLIAYHTGITTVADFRRMDMAGGGQGAPLAPAFHAARWRVKDEDRVVLNIGGISNLTLLPKDMEQAVSGYDIGPGNALLDAWTQRHLGQPQDTDSLWAETGTVQADLLSHLLSDPYFQQPAPKSTGKDYFNLSWLDRYLEDFPGLATEDVQATLVDLTIQSIAQVLNQLPMQRLLVCGGGVHNPLLITRLNQVLAPCPVESTEDHGIDPDWVEACCFAWLAQQRLQQKPGNLPQVTGARQPLVLGGVYTS